MRFDLSGFGVVLQAAVFDRIAFDPFAVEKDGSAAPEVDLSRSEIAEALVIPGIV